MGQVSLLYASCRFLKKSFMIIIVWFDMLQM
nr:MAG TPA: hypothetical protein [Caudoviricetes sp.]